MICNIQANVLYELNLYSYIQDCQLYAQLLSPSFSAKGVHLHLRVALGKMCWASVSIADA